MTELLAVLTVIFVVYVLYEVFKTVSQADQGQSPAAASAPAAAPSASAPASPAETAEVSSPAAAEAERSLSLRNPDTGETTPAPSNYRFAKKWIKEALVTEGLLDKIYKNSELTETVNGRVKDALVKFRQLEKYHA